MSLINKTKTGDCSFCSNTNCAVVKIGKSYYCYQKCYKNHKTSEALAKHHKKNALPAEASKVRMLSNSIQNREKIVGKDMELEMWFIHRSKEMTGRCVECGKPSTKNNPKYWKFSICHILPKAIFISVKTHPLNFIELCYFENSHHSNMDNMGYEYVSEKMPNAWRIIVQRFKAMYPAIKEKSKIPDILLQEIEPDDR